MKKIKLLTLFILVIMITGCSTEKDSRDEITLVLDWTPNTNHTGFYVADKLGYYEDAGIKINIVQPPEGGATQLVASSRAEFGIDFQDSIAPAFSSEEPLPVTAIAALLQHNTSGIISLEERGISSPRDMENINYATWDMPVEKAIIENVMEKDGGDFTKLNLIPTYVTDVIAGLNQNIDAIWVYYGWDKVAADIKGVKTNFFFFKDINPVLDYYSPILVGNNTFMENNKELTRKFLEATQKGYEYSIDNPIEAANILLEAVPELDENLIKESQNWISKEYKAESEIWGYIDAGRWDNFYAWLFENNLIEIEIPRGFGYTNEYLLR